ncbi:MAG TPA: fused MFS/spermidine synthase [bacterium]|nr:fused MFS/spermidine synthase [bacterium]
MKNKLVAFVFIAFTVSGATGLVYEVIWQRQLALIFGTTLPATTAVLTAFMGGLALGSWLFGKIADRMTHPVRMYGVLEILIGIYCFFMPMLFTAVHTMHVHLFSQMGPSVQLNILRFVLSVAILTVPCALMGGTFPILSRGIIRKSVFMGRGLSRLYFFNTIGAACGTLLAGFLLIRRLGMLQTNMLTAGCNVVLGLILVVFTAKIAFEKPIVETKPMKQRPSLTGYLPYIYALLGMAAMGTEVAWTRALNLILGSTVYAFSMMLGSYLLGLAVGSLAAGKITDRMKNSLAVVGVLGFLVSIAIALSIALTDRLPVFLVMLYNPFHHHFFVWQLCLFILSLLIVFPATFFMGALFPAFGKAYISKMDKLGRQVGRLYLWNTLGGIAGSLAAGFVLIPTIGTQATLTTFAAIFLGTGIFILLISIDDRKSRFQLGLLCIICVSGYQLIPDWDPRLLDSGAYVYAPMLVNGFEANRTMLYDNEGFHSHVTVSEKNNVRSLRINGKTDGSDGDDLSTQILLAVLPLAHIPDAGNALVVGLGTGVTAGSALNFPHLDVTCVEIDDAVIEAASFFNHVSGNPFNNQRFHILHADARTVLSAGDSTWDVIISEPSNPWITGVSNLFTVEYFISALDSLSEKGVMCQWIHSYYMDPDTLLVILRSFNSVFPHCTLWQGSIGDYLILGSRQPLTPAAIDLNILFQNTAATSDLHRIGIQTPEDFLANFLLSSSAFDRLTSETGDILNTDNHPYVEFNAPMSLYQDTVSDNRSMILAYQVDP